MLAVSLLSPLSLLCCDLDCMRQWDGLSVGDVIAKKKKKSPTSTVCEALALSLPSSPTFPWLPRSIGFDSLLCRVCEEGKRGREALK